MKNMCGSGYSLKFENFFFLRFAYAYFWQLEKESLQKVWSLSPFIMIFMSFLIFFIIFLWKKESLQKVLSCKKYYL